MPDGKHKVGAEQGSCGGSDAARLPWYSLVAGAVDPVLVADRAGHVLFANAAARALLGHPAALADLSPALADLTDGAATLFCRTEAGNGVTLDVSVSLVEPEGLRLLLLRDSSARRDTEDALQQIEERLASISANLPGIVFQRVLYPDGSLFYPFFTNATRDVLGYAPEEMRTNAEGCLEVVHWADRSDHLKAVRESAARMEPAFEEFRAITRSGEMRWLRGSSRPHALPEGEVIWDGVLIDVTDRKMAELRLQMIMDHAADCIVTMDDDGTILSANAAAEHIFGYAAGELVGQPVGILMPEPYRSKHAQFVTHYVQTGEGGIIGRGPRELVGLRKDGTMFPLELATSEVRHEGKRTFIGISRDITLRKRTEAALRESETRLRNIASNLPGLVFQRVLKPDGRLDYPYVSEGSRDVLGLDPADLMADGSLFLEVLAPEEPVRFMAALRRSARTLEPLDEEVRIILKDGSERWLRGQSRPRQLENGDISWEGVSLDVTDRKRAEEELRFQAYYDRLTRLPNRELFAERFRAAKPVAQFSDGIIAILSLGVDRFSIINTTLGHDIGDQVLAAVSQRLKGCLNDGDTIARASGDRFLVMLTGVTRQEEIKVTIEQVLLTMAEPLTVGDEDFDLTACVGYSLFPRDGDDVETLIRNADAALMRAKDQGPGTLQEFTRAMNDQAQKQLSLSHRLRRALENEEFVPFFQPQVDLGHGQVVGMEALVRWISPDGMVPPGEFIPVAEEFGLIDAIFEQMLRRSCLQNQAWCRAGLASVPVAVNLSGRQFQQPRRLIQTLEMVLEESGLDPHLLELELTESSAMRDPEAAISVVRTLNEMGISCSIDDFGTGYSSLSVLKRFPIQKLKIDRSFVMDVTTDANDAAICSAIVAMAHALRLKVVAEGVEEMGHLDFLRSLRCDTMQGYFFSRPLSGEDMEKLFREGRKLDLQPLENLEAVG